MWGYVSNVATADERRAVTTSAAGLLHTTSVLAIRAREPYLLTSTALSDLLVFAGTGESTTDFILSDASCGR